MCAFAEGEITQRIQIVMPTETHRQKCDGVPVTRARKQLAVFKLFSSMHLSSERMIRNGAHRTIQKEAKAQAQAQAHTEKHESSWLRGHAGVHICAVKKQTNWCPSNHTSTGTCTSTGTHKLALKQLVARTRWSVHSWRSGALTRRLLKIVPMEPHRGKTTKLMNPNCDLACPIGRCKS